MTPEQQAAIESLAGRAMTDDEIAMAEARSDGPLAESLSVGRARAVEHFVTERGVISSLGVIDGEAFIGGLEAFAAAALPDGHPLKAAHPGIGRMLRWIKSEGINMGDPESRRMLDFLAMSGVVTAASAAVIKGLAERPDPIGGDAISNILNHAE